MKYLIRDAAEGDLEEIVRMENELFSFPHTYDQLKNELKGNMHELLAAVSEEGRVLGYAGMSYVVDEGYISNIAVEKSFRRNGIAESLLEKMKERAKELQLAFISLEVRQSNLPAISLYGKQNFEKTGFLKNYYSHPAENAVIMTWVNK